MTKRAPSALFNAKLAITALDVQQTGTIMSNIRTANKRHKRHKRAIAATHERNQAAKNAAVEAAQPVQSQR